MQYLVTAEEMRSCDRNTIGHFGVPALVLMERAALAVSARIGEWKEIHKITRPMNVLVVCGYGNNGGDGIAIARILYQHGYIVQIALVGDEAKASEELKIQKNSAAAYHIPMDSFSKVRANKSQMEWDIIVDAILGIGCSRNLEGIYAEAVLYINECKKLRDESMLIAAVDIPSGISTDTGSVCGVAVRADLTVTFNFAKMGELLYPGTDYVGNLYVEDIGITADGFMGMLPRYFFFDERPADLLPKRIGAGNKGTFGKILVIAGNEKGSGACVLCASAALHAGAGMVKVITPKNNLDAIRNNVPEAMYDAYSPQNSPENMEKIRTMIIENLNWATCVVIGPGLGKSEIASYILHIVLSLYRRNVIIDADALNLIAEDPKLEKEAAAYSTSKDRWLIMTPHVAEFAKLYAATVGKKPENHSLDMVTPLKVKENILLWPRELAEYFHCAVLCKDARSVAAEAGREQMYVNISGNSGMATAGSGDVLSGILGAFSARNLGGFQTACIGAFIHGIAGNLAGEKLGEYYMTAGDIIRELSNALPRQ